MASNKELIAEIQALALDLGIEIEKMPTNNIGLSDLLAELNKGPEVETPPAPDTHDEALAMVEAEVVKPIMPPYYVADGHSITSKRGILSAGDEVDERSFSGGMESVNDHVKKGFVIKNGA